MILLLVKNNPETMEIIIDKKYQYKDGRIVKIVQYSEKRERLEVIIGKYNPFWININDLISKNDKK